MPVRVPRLPFSLDPLIAEAKRRANRRRLIVACLVVVLAAGAAGAILALRSPPSHRLTLPAVHRLGIARIPGMAKLASSGWQPGAADCVQGWGHGPVYHPPPFGGYGSLGCACKDPCGGWVAGELREVWVSSAAVAKEGMPRLREEMSHGFPYRPVRLPADVIRRSGPAEVEVLVLGQLSWPAVEQSRRRDAEEMVRSGYSEPGSVFTPLPGWTINGGVARHIHSNYNFGMNKFQFIWAAGTKVVMVNVFGGARLHLSDAQKVAALAGPSE